MRTSFIRNQFIANLKSGFTVSLVGIPLSISLAVVSGVSPVVGIITAIWAGLIASLFGGSNYNIIGPTGALSGLIASYALAHGAKSISMLAVCAGIFILIAYWLHFEKYLIFIPASVIHGFTLGVACIIGFSQLNWILGLSGLAKYPTFIENVGESLRTMHLFSCQSLLIFSVFFLAQRVLRKFVPAIPGAIILSPLGILVGYLADKNIISAGLETLGGTFGPISVTLMQVPTIAFSSALIMPAMVVALVAILETMLSAKIADTLTHTKHKPSKEILGLGLANIASGFMGGMPATAALARTAFNIRAGATSHLSATVNSVCIALCSLLFLSTFSFMPMAVIAAFLVNVAIGMVEYRHFVRFYMHDRTHLCIALLVAFITVYEDPIFGILAGTVIALLVFAQKISHGKYAIVEHTYRSPDDVLVYAIRGKLVYLNSLAHVSRFQLDFKKYRVIILRLDEMFFLDLDGIEALDEIIDHIKGRGQTVMIAGLEPHLIPLLHASSKEFRDLENAGHVFAATADALAFAK